MTDLIVCIKVLGSVFLNDVYYEYELERFGLEIMVSGGTIALFKWFHQWKPSIITVAALPRPHGNVEPKGAFLFLFVGAQNQKG